METIIAILGILKSIIVSTMALSTNTAIVNFISNNIILLGIISLLAKATSWKWDNFISRWIKGIVEYVKPNAKLPDDEE